MKDGVGEPVAEHRSETGGPGRRACSINVYCSSGTVSKSSLSEVFLRGKSAGIGFRYISEKVSGKLGLDRLGEVNIRSRKLGGKESRTETRVQDSRISEESSI